MKPYTAVALFLLSTSELHAYLDPGTGSILIQGLIAGIAAAALIVKTYWYRIKSLFAGDRPEDLVTEETNATNVEQKDTPL